MRVVSNAGGINPHACAAALGAVAKKAGVELKIATVTGDDILSKVLNLYTCMLGHLYITCKLHIYSQQTYAGVNEAF